MRSLTYAAAIHEATVQEMERNSSVFVFGLGVDDFRGIYGTTLGLTRRFGADRCFDTPLSEDAMTGVAVGAALAGQRPIHVHIRMDFMLLAMNQLVNMAAKLRYMSGGAVKVPMVVRAVIGRSWGQGAQHSQGLHSLFMHIPGLKVVAPATAYDAKGALAAAVRDDNPVVFVEHRMLHDLESEVPQASYAIKWGQARTLASGDDVTIVGISYMVVEAMRARQMLAGKGVSAEVIDPVTLSPLDFDSIASSVRRTGRLLVVDNGWAACGASAEIIAGVVERLAPGQKALCRRQTLAPAPCPTTRPLERHFYPTAASIAAEARAMVTGDDSWSPGAEEAPELRGFKGPF